MNPSINAEEIETLIKQAKTGDRGAFDLLYSQLYTPLFRFVKSRTGNHDRALDICQDTFLRWYKSLDSYEVKMRPLSYLMMISMRLIINESKKTDSLHLPDEAEEYLDSGEVTAPENLDFNLDFQKVKDLFELLSDNQKNVLTMRYVADADTVTIAEALNVKIDNVRKIESRALQKLKALYDEKYKTQKLHD